MVKDLYLTPEGLEKLKSELERLKTVERKDVIERLKQAKEYGDLSENAEYEEAKKSQALVEARIQELEEMIRRAKVVVHRSGAGQVDVGTRVKVAIDGKHHLYEIVGTTEADPMNGKISADSPIGKALLGRGKGETVDVHVPAGNYQAKILDVS